MKILEIIILSVISFRIHIFWFKNFTDINNIYTFVLFTLFLLLFILNFKKNIFLKYLLKFIFLLIFSLFNLAFFLYFYFHTLEIFYILFCFFVFIYEKWKLKENIFYFILFSIFTYIVFQFEFKNFTDSILNFLKI